MRPVGELSTSLPQIVGHANMLSIATALMHDDGKTDSGEVWPFNASVCQSVTTERLSKLRKITGKKQARFPLGPQWPPVTGSKQIHSS